MRSVLVTGATTPFGDELVRQLLDDEGVAHVLAVGVEARETVLPYVSDKLTYVQADFTHMRKIRELMFGPALALGVDTVMHGALHRKASDGGQRVHRLNVECTRLLLQLAERHPTVQRFVFASSAHVYKIRSDRADLIAEEHPLNLSPAAPQWVRDRIEADLTVCTRMGMSRVKIAVLRFAEIFAAHMGSQMWDYLHGRVCLRPMGYDPMLNLLTIADAVDAAIRALKSDALGIFNVPGSDTAPVSEIIRLFGRTPIPVPSPLMEPLYAARQKVEGSDFRFDLNQWRFHHSAILDGRRAEEVLGYSPRRGYDWPAPWAGPGAEPVAPRQMRAQLRTPSSTKA